MMKPMTRRSAQVYRSNTVRRLNAVLLATLSVVVACAPDPSGTYRGTGELVATIRPADLRTDDRHVTLTSITMTKSGDGYDLTLGPDCVLHGTASYFADSAPPRCTLRTDDGGTISLRNVSLSVSVSQKTLVLTGICVSVRADGETGSCLPSFTGTR